MQTLSPEQLDKLSEISNPLVRRRFSIFYQLPPDMQESMLAEGTAQSIWNITKEKYVLSDTNTSAVAKVIGLIFLGELPIKNFITALKNELGVDIQKAQAIAQDINTAIFQPVRNSLMEVHGIQRDTNTRIRANDTNTQEPTNRVSAPTREELLNRLRTKPNQSRPRIIDPAASQPANRAPYQARPAYYRAAAQRNVIDLRTARRKNRSKKSYRGFFADY